MPRICTVCSHPQRAMIDAALVGGTMSGRKIAALYCVSDDAIARHKADHLPGRLVQAQGAREVAQADDLLAQVRNLQGITMGLLGNAYAAGDLRTAVAAIGQARGNLELLGKLIGELAQQPTINVLVASPQWLQTRTRVLHALEAYPDARQAVVYALADDG